MNEAQLRRRLAALVSADVVGYSRLMADDEIATVRSLAACRERVSAAVRAGGGRVVDFVGDNMLAEFPNTLDAVGCAFAIQRSLADLNAGVSDQRRLSLRIGVHLGDVMDDGERIYGDGIIIAARLEALADPGGICISDDVYRQIRSKFKFDCLDLGERELKNIPGPLRVYQIVETDTPRPDSAAPAAAQPPPSLPPTAKPSLAVLPFVNLSDDPGQDHFAAGLTLDIMAALIRIPGLFLIGEETMLSYRATPLPLRDIGRRLGVSHVLEGGVRRSDSRIRVTARLFETAGGRQLWAERYDRNLDDIFAIQDDITVEIVTAMDVQLVSGEAGRIVRQALKQPAAIEAYYRGWGGLLGSSAEEIVFSQQMFEEAARLEPQSSLGFALAAWSHWWSVDRKTSDDVERSLSRAEALAREALRIGDVTGMAELVLAEIHLYKKEYERALAASERAVLARPSCSESFVIKASVLNYLGRPAEAVELARYAIRLSPVYPAHYAAVLASAYYGCELFEAAIDAADTCLAADPENLDALLVAAAAGVALGRRDRARAAAETVRRVKPGFTLAARAAGQPYKDPQRLEQMMEMLRRAGLQ